MLDVRLYGLCCHVPSFLVGLSRQRRCPVRCPVLFSRTFFCRAAGSAASFTPLFSRTFSCRAQPRLHCPVGPLARLHKRRLGSWNDIAAIEAGICTPAVIRRALLPPLERVQTRSGRRAVPCVRHVRPGRSQPQTLARWGARGEQEVTS